MFVIIIVILYLIYYDSQSDKRSKVNNSSSSGLDPHTSQEFNISRYSQVSGNNYLSTIEDSGKFGEYLTFKKLEQIKTYNKLLVNVYVPIGNDKYSEVDLIMICETGIYVFESKNYSGWIFGDEKNSHWTQSLSYQNKYRFYNPIWQNKGHISALKSFIKTNEDRLFKSYIVFSERSELIDVVFNSNKTKIIHRYDLLETVEKDIEESQQVLSRGEIDRIHQALKPYSNVSKELKASHIARLKQDSYICSKAQTKNINKEYTCPRCGSELVLRVAKRGDNKGNEFYGCSSYPKCRYIKDAD